MCLETVPSYVHPSLTSVDVKSLQVPQSQVEQNVFCGVVGKLMPWEEEYAKTGMVEMKEKETKDACAKSSGVRMVEQQHPS